ncbi:MAG: EAL domain-containing protein, partial [Nitrospirota bacterium]|nr:EAL domain-containing protein [Nitrospirota bacterium]
EIWNRRKNGEVYPERLTITEIRDSSARVTQYAAVFYDITEIKQNEMKIEYKAYHDALTGLPNRQLFYDRLRQTIKHAKRANTIFALLYIDLDDFKIINDSKGHSFGDLFLKELARRLQIGARSEDTVSRLGGDEFTIILDKLQEEEEAALVASRIVKSISKPFVHRNEVIYASVSIGIALYPDNGNSTEVLLKNADIAMYHAKETGKNNFHFFTKSLNEKILKQVALEKALRKGMDNAVLETYYQPIVRLQDRHIAGMEALVRWPQGNGHFISPVEFIPLAEEKGMIVEIDKLMIKNVCTFIQKMNTIATKNTQDLRVAINISAVDFEHLDLCKYLTTIVEKYGLSPKNIGIEITESAIIRNIRATVRHLKKLRSHGFKISIDDFGTGYSSLNYLARLPIDILKIDGFFVKGLPGNKNNTAITKGIVYMAHEMGIEVIAEGVETEEQLDFLREIGCDFVQGYIFSRPLEATKIAALLIKGKPLNYKDLELF